MTRSKRIEIIRAARTLADNGEVELARAIFALVGTTAVLPRPIDETPFRLIDAHIEAIKGPHVAAFRGPVRRDYQPGEVVWMYDHYNTAVVQGPSSRADSWTVTTTDADGESDTYEYLAAHLRPAAAPVEFRWAQAVR